MNKTLPSVSLLLPVCANAQGAERIAFEGLQGVIVGGTLAVLGYLILLIYRAGKKAKQNAAPKVEHFKKETLPKIGRLAAKSGAAISNRAKTEEEKVLEIGDEFFETASAEISQNTQSKGLWLKSLALAEGEEAKQKAIYIRLRAKQLSETAATDEAGSVEDEIEEGESSDALLLSDEELEEIERKKQQEREADLRRLEEKFEEAAAIKRKRSGTRFLVFALAISAFIAVLVLNSFGVGQKQTSNPPPSTAESQGCTSDGECYDPN